MALSPIRSLKPQSKSTTSAESGFANALKLFQEASRRIPAYADFLKKSGINPRLIKSRADFEKVPRTDKVNYISQYNLKELSWDGSLKLARCVSTSSGSTGVPFFWPRGQQHDVVINLMIENMFRRIIGTDKGSTLTVDSFALGPWIAGFEFFNAAKWASARGNQMVVLTPGIDKTEAVLEIMKLASNFDRVVIGGYPPFIKDIVEQGRLAGFDWKSIDLYIIAGGESISDIWKDRFLELIGRPGELRRIISEFGMAEVGVVANDTPVSTVLRRSLRELATLGFDFPDYDNTVGLYQYYPTARYFETAADGSLMLTSDAGLPLIRYDTRDKGGVLDYSATIEKAGTILKKNAKQYRVNLGSWRLPFLYLQGRMDFAVTLYALNIYVENIKRALEQSSHASHLSGLFTMDVRPTENLDPQLHIQVELTRDSEPNTALAESLVPEVVHTLCKLNTEYAKLHSSIGERANPKITLLRYGEIQTIPGRKHKWFKRTA